MSGSVDLQIGVGPLEHFYREAGRRSGSDRSLRLDRISAGPHALDTVVDLAAGGREGRAVVVGDRTEILRDGVAVKRWVAQAFRDAGFDVELVVIGGEDELHTTPEHVTEVRTRLRHDDTVVVVGSGTIVDITKHAVLALEESGPSSDVVLTAVQTANSVCAFTSGLTVLTSDGVKRTVPSRLVDRLLLDTTLLSQAPRDYTLGGIGDAAVSASSIADYRLAHLLGQGRWEPLAWDVVEPGRELFLGGAPAWADPGVAGAERLGLDLAACGLAMTFAGESAPLSGLEHVTSHMLDMAAGYRGRLVGNHGSQCGLATALVLIAFEVLLDEVDLQSVDLDARAVDRDAEELSVRTAFEHLDADGATWRECWSDYSTKLDAWRAGASTIRDFQASWPAHRDDLRRYLVPADEYMRALAVAGHPLSWSDVPPGIGEDEARWAFENARLMRKRVSVADVLYFAGVWSTSFVDRIFDRFHEICDEIAA